MNVEFTNWLESILHLAVGSTIVMATGLFTMAAYRRQSSATRHLAGTLTCFALLMLPVAVSAFPSWHLALMHVSSPKLTSDTLPRQSADNTPDGTFPRSMPRLASELLDPQQKEIVLQSSETANSPSSTPPATAYLFVSYLIGVAFGLLRLITGHVFAIRLRINSGEFLHSEFDNSDWAEKTAVEHGVVAVRSSARISVPMVTGLLRPVVLLPAAASHWSLEQLRSVIAHETAHVERHDLGVQLVARIVAIAYWPHPLVHLLISTMRIHRESACDDIAISIGQPRTHYARHLLNVAVEVGQQTVRDGALAMARSSNVEKRIKAILSTTRCRTPPTMKITAKMLALIIASLLSVTWISPFTEGNSVVAEEAGVLAETDNDQTEKPRATEEFRATGRVVDADGRSVPGALLVSEIYGGDGSVITLTQTADAQGNFEMAYPPHVGQSEMFHTWAYAKGHSIRVVMMRAKFRKSRMAKDVQIQLPKSESTNFRLLLPDGTPCRNALVGAESVSIPNGVFTANEPTGLASPVPDKLAELIVRRTNDAGEFAIDSVPSALLYSVSAMHPEYGKQEFPTDYKDLQLSPVGSISGVVKVDLPQRFAGTKVYIKTSSPLRQRLPQTESSVTRGSGIALVKLDAGGEFQIPAIAEGVLSMFFMIWDQNSDVHPIGDEHPSHMVSSSTILNLSVETRPVVTLNGQILRADTREPVIGARMHMRNTLSPSHGSQAATDKDGNFSVRVPWGKITQQLIAMGNASNRYDYRSLEQLVVMPAPNSIQLEPILLSPRKSSVED